MKLKELKEAFNNETCINYCGRKHKILGLETNLTSPFRVEVTLFCTSVATTKFSLVLKGEVELRILSLWKEPTNKEENVLVRTSKKTVSL